MSACQSFTYAENVGVAFTDEAWPCRRCGQPQRDHELDDDDLYSSCGFDGPEDAAKLEAELNAEFPELTKQYNLATTRLLRRMRRKENATPPTDLTPPEQGGFIHDDPIADDGLPHNPEFDVDPELGGDETDLPDGTYLRTKR